MRTNQFFEWLTGIKSMLAKGMLLLCLVCGAQTAMAQASENNAVAQQLNINVNECVKCTGKIGPYQVTLYVNPHSSAGEWTGYYFYNQAPKSVFKLKMVKNEGNPNGFNKMTLWEYTKKGKHTGTFQGVFEGRGDGFNGTFTNSKKQQFRFELVQQY